MVAQFPGKVTLVSENFGASKLAERFGVTRYPAVFVNDILVARPRDFGFFAEGEDGGRYTPWRNADSQAHFKADLERMVRLALAGREADLRAERAAANGAQPPGAAAGAPSTNEGLAALPKFSLAGLDGQTISNATVAGRVVVVEFWATWCPPCRSTLEWLAGLKAKYGDRLAVVALAVESPEAAVRAAAATVPKGILWAIADPPTAQAFGNVVAVPTMWIFDREGKAARVLYGAPPDLHASAQATLDALSR